MKGKTQVKRGIGIGIKSDGTPRGTKILTDEGKQISGVTKVEFKIETDDVMRARLDVLCFNVDDVKAELDKVRIVTSNGRDIVDWLNRNLLDAEIAGNHERAQAFRDMRLFLFNNIDHRYIDLTGLGDKYVQSAFNPAYEGTNEHD